ncbi:MAG TPA: methylated-DNA--[protein]-cysteine S-methyltransferase [Thermoanaerobaculia bacterium]|nr:methylated-DNA--[protein]-cysteine S-methyltransferase [Thermoanaerobaculia bacterium]
MAARSSTETPLCFDLFEDDLGWALAIARGGKLIALEHRPSREDSAARRARRWPEARHDPAAEPLPEVRRQLAEYLSGTRRDFDLPLETQGTEFQRAVWGELLRIPFGATRSYGEIARRLARPAASRAVGLANHDNPIGVVIPCHRVIGSDGSLTGYAGGLEMKRRLLELEGALPGRLRLEA